MAKIIDLKPKLEQKARQEELKKQILSSGWDSATVHFMKPGGIILYLIDTVEPCLLAFGCDRADLPSSSIAIHWGQFVLAWDVVADPSMPVDDKHLDVTRQFALRALAGLDQWDEFSRKAIPDALESKAHILVIVDRKNMDEPADLIAAHSDIEVMDVKTIQSLIKGYVSS